MIKQYLANFAESLSSWVLIIYTEITIFIIPTQERGILLFCYTGTLNHLKCGMDLERSLLQNSEYPPHL